jgi:diguanylate cyclase (GGDEF)-like protein
MTTTSLPTPIPVNWEQTVAKNHQMVDQDSDSTGCLLQIYPVSLERQLVLLNEAMQVIGRDDSADIIVADASISRRHASIERTEQGYWISDLGSTNGTFVNEKRVDRSPLVPGDRVQLGGYIFKFLSRNHIELQYHEAIYSMMTRDGLTGTLNKRYLMDLLEREFRKAAHRQTPLTLILFDIDHFKSVNDTYGHLAGDEVLKEVANRIDSVIAEHDVFARYGGEEFAILLTGISKKETVDMAERCRQIIESSPFTTSVGPLTITISLGVSEFRDLEVPTDANQLVQAADEKLYQSKRAGRNRVSS